jgi:pimeloyl-[acyl-carrier protein] methyl ester esterase
MPFIETPGGVTIHYEDAGSGPALVLVHGWSMSGRVWAFQEELADAYRLITLDLRGHGASSAPAAGYAFVDFAADLASLFAQLELREATLVGWSMGAQVALQAFTAVRARLTALVLVSGTPRFTAAADYPYGLPAREGRGMALRLKRDYAKTMGEFFRGMFGTGELSRDHYQQIVRQIVIPGRRPAPHAAMDSLAALNDEDQRQILPLIDLPTLIIHGDRDTICLPGAAYYMAERIVGARLGIMNGVGHAPFLSRPAEFNAILIEFLQGVYGRN